MPYYNLIPEPQMNFTVNRMLTYGEESSNLEEVKKITGRIKNFEDWFNEWKTLADKAVGENRYMHAFYYYRMAEFFLTEARTEKTDCYNRCIEYFNKAIAGESIERQQVPFEGSWLPAIRFQSSPDKPIILVHGGYDSFIEEFYLTCKEIHKKGYTIILFEGPGQGTARKNGLVFTEKWEKPVAAILDYFKVTDAALIGISWGGYLASRAAAFDDRIKQVVAYDVLYDGLDFITYMMPRAVKMIFRFLVAIKASVIINALVNRVRKRKAIADWAITHGMYITGTKSPYEFFRRLSKHRMNGLGKRIKQDVLLLAGEKDHFIPVRYAYRMKKDLVNARTVTLRVFTEKEGGEQHCQVGNHQIAIDTIVNWLNQHAS